MNFKQATTQILILSVIQRGAIQTHCLQHWDFLGLIQSIICLFNKQSKGWPRNVLFVQNLCTPLHSAHFHLLHSKVSIDLKGPLVGSWGFPAAFSLQACAPYSEQGWRKDSRLELRSLFDRSLVKAVQGIALSSSSFFLSF